MDHFDDELGGEDLKLSPSHGGRPFKDMKSRYAPEFVSLGSLNPCVEAQILENNKMTAKLETWPGGPKIYHVQKFFLEI